MKRLMMIVLFLVALAVSAPAQECKKCQYYGGGGGYPPATTVALCMQALFGETGYNACAENQVDCHNGQPGPCTPHCHLGGQQCEYECPAGYEYDVLTGQCQLTTNRDTHQSPTVRYWYYFSMASGGHDPYNDDCEYTYEGCWSPIMRKSYRGPWHLTSVAAGVRFDIAADGVKRQIGWTEPGTEQAFLVCDFNNNSDIDSGAEMFGNHTQVASGAHAFSLAANGFAALETFDNNSDGLIDPADPIWAHLRWWTDRNHDAKAQASELEPVGLTTTALGLDYKASRRNDGQGNVFKYRATIYFADGHFDDYFDVYLAGEPKK